MTIAKESSTYEETPYPGMSYSQTHPDRLATVATLLGLEPPPVECCRILAVGCASGWNLLPMAYGLPESSILGIDRSPSQIRDGQEMVARLEFHNLELRAMDILDVGPELGRFDYIIAHGVFSWVPAGVQDKLLEVCRQNLAPAGVAYVSYNTYPGWHMLRIIRDMMLYRTRDIASPHERATEARALLDFLAQSISPEDSAYGNFLNTYAEFLRGELKGMSESGNAFLLHDELEKVNEPIYFHEFMDRASQHALQYLGEAEFRTMLGSNFEPGVMAHLNGLSRSVIDLEQYMDYFRNRTFRQTLLCHRSVTVSRSLRPEALRRFYVASNAQPVEADFDVHATTVAQFRGLDGATLSTDHPVSKAAMLCLAEHWPRDLRFDELLALARERLGKDQAAPSDELETDAKVLGTNLLRAYGYSGSLAELHVYAPDLALRPGDRPTASPVARLQAARSTRVTNLRHERVRLDELDRFLLQQLDGRNDRAALVELLLAGPVQEGQLSVQEGNQPVGDAQRMRDLLAKGLAERLDWLAGAALLVA
jgi:methyltransferase-like protein/protein-L-isoaspartate O-methyltransferase